MPFDDILLQSFIYNFYGYGTYNARCWFIGMEEGGGNSFTEVDRRLSIWNGRGGKELEDVAGYHIELGMPEFFSEVPKLQTTWNKLIRILLSAEGQDPTTDQVRDYQKSSLGRSHGDTCLLELLPLPSPSTGHWMYATHSALPYLSNRDTYRGRLSESRADHIRQRIQENAPGVVVFYSLNQEYQHWWRYIAGIEFNSLDELRLYWGEDANTLFLITKPPAAKGVTNQYFHDIGHFIAVHPER